MTERGFPPCPDGWFAVAWSDELKPGQVRPLRVLGRDLVLFRTGEGRPAVLDAHCPHLGAHLGVGGCVVGETVQCPFHQWRFDAEGACQAIPEVKRIPARTSLRAWPTAEVNGLVQIFHHAQGAPPPSPPVALDGPGWTTLARWNYELRSHPQEIAENVSDLAHFLGVHRVEIGAPELRVEGRSFRVCVEALPLLKGRPIPLRSRIEMTSHELGHVAVNLQLPSLANVYVLAYATPIEGDRVAVRHRYVAEIGHGAAAAGRWLVGQAVRWEAMAQVRQDRLIWEHKIHRARPRLVETDRLLGPFRRWARQFYSEPAASP